MLLDMLLAKVADKSTGTIVFPLIKQAKEISIRAIRIADLGPGYPSIGGQSYGL
jgi:hypothetical protein